MPDEGRYNPLGQLGQRLLIGVLMLAITTLGTYIERDGYADSADGAVSLLDALYYATVSVTTTGYGDVVPVSDAARLFTTFVVTPARIVFLVLLVGTSVELIATASRSIIREGRWRKRVQDHVVICGFGVKGRTALDSLREQGEPGDRVVVIDPYEEALATAARLGCIGIHGDASSNELLLAAQIDRARVVIITPNRDDAAVLTTLSVRNLNPTVRIVAAARELENAPLLRSSGADVVLTTSGATGRMMGLAANAPHYVQVVEELLETGAGLDLVERRIDEIAAGTLNENRREGELVVAVFRGDELIARNPTGDFELRVGDDVVSVAAPVPI
jgi:voltage-gated potassium channel